MSTDVSSDMKTCPFCAEKIKSAAIVCRYCGKDIEINKSTKKDRAAGDEVIYFQNFNALVTSHRFVAGQTTYALGQIVAVNTWHEHDSMWLKRVLWIGILLLVWVLILVIGLVFTVVGDSAFVTLIVTVVDLVGLGAAFYLPIRHIKPVDTFHLMIDTASGKTRAYSSESEELIQRIEQSLVTALSVR